MQETLVHDGAGRVKSDALWTYHWDSFWRLKQMVRKPGLCVERGAISETVDFTYDADGRRTEKVRTVGLENEKIRVEKSSVLWSGWLPLLEIRQHHGIEISRHWFQWGRDLSGTLEGAGGIGGLLAIIEERVSKPARTLLPVQDGLGNVTAVFDAADGSLVARYDYGPFGEPLGESGDVDACPFRYQTKWYDKESEHYYFGCRYYSPRLGRWLSRDPLGEAGGFNLYAYCGNDPVNKVDSLGLSPGGYRGRASIRAHVKDPKRRDAMLKEFDEIWDDSQNYGYIGPVALLSAPLAAVALPELTPAAYAGVNWLFAGGGMQAISMWGARTAFVAGAGTVAYDASQGASPMDSLQHGAGVAFNLWSATGLGMPNLRMQRVPSFRFRGP